MTDGRFFYRSEFYDLMVGYADKLPRAIVKYLSGPVAVALIKTMPTLPQLPTSELYPILGEIDSEEPLFATVPARHAELAKLSQLAKGTAQCTASLGLELNVLIDSVQFFKHMYGIFVLARADARVRKDHDKPHV